MNEQARHEQGNRFRNVWHAAQCCLHIPPVVLQTFPKLPIQSMHPLFSPVALRAGLQLLRCMTIGLPPLATHSSFPLRNFSQLVRTSDHLAPLHASIHRKSSPWSQKLRESSSSKAYEPCRHWQVNSFAAVYEPNSRPISCTCCASPFSVLGHRAGSSTSVLLAPARPGCRGARPCLTHGILHWTLHSILL